ncbi:MAG: CRISPR-associated protein Cas4 [Bacillota bacterium]
MLNNGERAFRFTVTDIKQYQYCPRIIYFTYVQPVPRRVTRLMKFGEERHLEMERLEPRRVVRKYGLDEGEKIYRETFHSERLGLSGKLDMSIHAPGAVYPVEFKFTLEREPRRSYIGQLAAYAMLLEEKYATHIGKGFFYFIPAKKIAPVDIKDADKDRVICNLQAIRELIAGETFPPGTKETAKCVDCEWRIFCGDIFIPERAKTIIGNFNNNFGS